MKKIIIIFLMLCIAGTVFSLSSEAKKSSGKGLSDDQITAMSATVEKLTEKMYGRGLFSPEDNENLIDIKLKLDDQMLTKPDVSLAPLYYKVGVLYKARDMKDEATDCFQTILENFSDTALAPKAAAQLKIMGVSIALPGKPGAAAGK